MKRKLFFIFAVSILSTAGLLLDRNADKSENVSFSLANVEALTDIEDDEPATQPEPGYFVPDSYIRTEVKKYELICAADGQLEITGHSISGDFSKGVSYSVLVESKNCDGEKKGAWCDQRMVGSRILSAYQTSPATPQP